MGLITDRELVASGGSGSAVGSARSGFMPVPLRYVPQQALKNIPVYLRNASAQAGDSACPFTLYRSENVEFTAEDRQRLLESGRRFVYIRIADQVRYREQTERAVAQAVADSTLAISEKSVIVYETSVELVNELLAEPSLVGHSQRLGSLARSISTVVLSDPGAFSHLFAASHHDFYTATHMVNVGTWMVPLAYALGHRKSAELVDICLAGLLHDIGKVFVPEQILN